MCGSMRKGGYGAQVKHEKPVYTYTHTYRVASLSLVPVVWEKFGPDGNIFAYINLLIHGRTNRPCASLSLFLASFQARVSERKKRH